MYCLRYTLFQRNHIPRTINATIVSRKVRGSEAGPIRTTITKPMRVHYTTNFVGILFLEASLRLHTPSQYKQPKSSMSHTARTQCTFRKLTTHVDVNWWAFAGQSVKNFCRRPLESLAATVDTSSRQLVVCAIFEENIKYALRNNAVSYTHLTLPTILRV